MNSYFFNVLHTIEAGPGRMKLAKALKFQDSRGRIWTVEEGFTTDLASYPKLLPGIFRLLMPGPLDNDKSAVLHDWSYFNAGERVWYTQSGATASMPILMTKDLADWLFREGMQAELPEGQRWKRWVPWLGVVIGGFLSWVHNYNRNIP